MVKKISNKQLMSKSHEFSRLSGSKSLFTASLHPRANNLEFSRSLNKYSRLTNFFYEIGSLRKIARTHRQELLTDDLSDNIAAHTFRVTCIGWFLAKEEKADVPKVTLMCLLHDISETRSGDQNWVNKKYVKVFENEIVNDQFSNLPQSKKLLSTIREYNKRNSKEARIAKDADLLEQILLLKEYSWQGNKEAKSWLRDNEQAKRLHTETAKRLVKEILDQSPNVWWSKLWTADRR